MQQWQQKLQQLHQWWQTPLGQRLLQAEKSFLQDYIVESFGYQMVLIAGEDYLDVCTASRMQNCLRIDPLTQSIDNLPDSIDAIIMPHVLLFEPNSAAWLEAIWQKLTVSGQLIITGYSRFSYLALQRLLKMPAVKQLPKADNNLRRLKQELVANHFHIVLQYQFAMRWLLGPAASQRAPSIVGDIGCIVAEKTLATVRRYQPKWRDMAQTAKSGFATTIIGEQCEHDS